MTVLSQASLTTTPCRTRLGMLSPCLRCLRLAPPLPEHGLDAGDIAPHLPHPRGVFELSARALEAQVENLLTQGLDLGGQLVVGAGTHIGRLHPLHDANSSPA